MDHLIKNVLTFLGHSIIILSGACFAAVVIGGIGTVLYTVVVMLAAIC